MNEVVGATLDQEQQGPRNSMYVGTPVLVTLRHWLTWRTGSRFQAYKHGKFEVVAFLLHLAFRDDVLIGISSPADLWDCCEQATPRWQFVRSYSPAR